MCQPVPNFSTIGQWLSYRWFNKFSPARFLGR